MKRAPLIAAAVVWLVAVAIVIVLAKGAVPDLARVYLTAWLVLISLPLGALPLLMGLEFAGGGETSLTAPLRLVLASLPLLSLLIAPVLLELKHVYIWAESTGPHGLVARWFTPGFFSLRGVVYLVIWNVLGLFFLRPARPSPRHRALAGFGLLLHLVVGTLAAFDWFMSLDEAFVSSCYGVLVIAAQCAFALTAAALIALFLDRRADLDRTAVLGLLVAAGIAAFAQFAEYLVIWSANLPKEIAWYQTRAHDALGLVFAVGAPILLAIAVVLLLPERLGRRPAGLLVALGALLVVELADLVLLASPRDSFTVTVVMMDLVVIIGMAGLACLCVFLVADKTTLRAQHG